MRSRTRSWLVVALLAAGCAGDTRLERARDLAAGGDLESARVALEQERERQPGSAEVRIALGQVYYRIARDALDRQRDEGHYLAFLERSVDEFVIALEIDPENDEPHFFLAVMDTYRGDLPSALRGFRNTLRLHPSGVGCTNLAEVYVYQGDLAAAERWNRVGRRNGAAPGLLTFNEMLMSWRRGDVRGASRRFESLRISDPELIRTINAAPLPREPNDFGEFAGYCCGSPACGPYLENACRDLGLDVQRREISNQTLLRELRIEIEKQRRLQKVYEQRKELEIDIEEPPPAPTP